MTDHPSSTVEAHVDTSLEAAELSQLRTRSNHTQHAATPNPNHFLSPVLDPIRKFWFSQISITTAHETCRDHLGKSKVSFFLPLQSLIRQLHIPKSLNTSKKSLQSPYFEPLSISNQLPILTHHPTPHWLPTSSLPYPPSSSTTSSPICGG